MQILGFSFSLVISTHNQPYKHIQHANIPDEEEHKEIYSPEPVVSLFGLLIYTLCIPCVD